jgi:hypothetical protein
MFALTRDAMTTTDTLDPQSNASEDPATRDFEYGGHVFVWARPRTKPWRHFDGTTRSLKHQDFEFRPCMLTGHESGRNLRIIGAQYSFSLDDFEIVEDAARAGR